MWPYDCNGARLRPTITRGVIFEGYKYNEHMRVFIFTHCYFVSVEPIVLPSTGLHSV